MIQFSTFLPISAPFLVSVPFECRFVKISAPFLTSASFLISAPFEFYFVDKRPLSSKCSI